MEGMYGRYTERKTLWCFSPLVIGAEVEPLVSASDLA
jgi:hypothetical protein